MTRYLPGLCGSVTNNRCASPSLTLPHQTEAKLTKNPLDIYKKLRPMVSEKRLVLIGRIATLGVVILGLMWIPIMPLISEGGLYQYLQSVQGYLAPPITAVFLL